MNAALLLLVLAAHEPPVDTPAVALDGWRFAGVPIFSYGSDVGLNLGAALFFYKSIPLHPEENQSANLSLSYATRGPRAIDSGYYVGRLFGLPLQAGVNLHLGDDPQMPYWGEGARLGGLSVPPGFGTPPAVYRYHDRRAFVAGTVRGKIAGPLGWHLRARYLYVAIPEQSALLSASVPPGARGGRVALGEAGLLFDTRDRDVNTHSGVFATAAAFAAPQIGGVSDFAFHGYDAALRVYVPLWLGATLALRGVYDRKIAGIPRVTSETDAVPFFERSLYEGIAFNEGLGGAATIRGIARYRLEGTEKMLANAQLRANVFTTHLVKRTQEYGLSVGLDAGRARQAGFRAVDAAGVAAGVRIVWDRTIVLRVEMARARGGDNTLYIALGEQF